MNGSIKKRLNFFLSSTHAKELFMFFLKIWHVPHLLVQHFVNNLFSTCIMDIHYSFEGCLFVTYHYIGSTNYFNNYSQCVL